MRRLVKLAVLAIALIGPWGLASSTHVRAQDTTGTVDAKGVEANAARAKQILKSMSDYMAAQQYVTARFDLDLEAFTPELQKIQFSSSGHVLLARPDKIHAWRTGGYSDVEL